MSEHAYLIAIDALDAEADVTAVKNHIKDDEAFTHWWSHLPAVFLVTSRLRADEIASRVRPFIGDAGFLVVGIKLDETEGWLREQSWQWIKHREQEINGVDIRRRDQVVGDHAGDRTQDA